MTLDLADSPSEFAGIACFAIAAWACWRAGGRAGLPWRPLAAVQAALLLEVALRSRYHLHDLVDAFASARGWYPQRAPVQIGLIALVVVLAALGWIAASRGRARGVLAGIAMVVTIAVVLLFAIEAVSLHGIDAVLYRQVGPFRVIAFGWVAAATLVTLSALAAARS